MATSGKYDPKFNRNDIIQEALELITVYDPGKTLDPEDLTACVRSLRMMIQALRAEDIGLWANKEAFLFPQHDTYKYLLGPNGDHCGLSAIKTELASAAASGATSITVDSYTGMANTFDRNAICLAQTPAGAGNFTLNGTIVSSSVAYLPSQRKILFYSSGDESGDTYTVTGTNADGDVVTETITGPGAAATVYSVNSYWTVTAIATNGAGTGNIECGIVGPNIGVELDGGTVHWTFASAAVSSTTLSLVTALTGAAAADNHVYVYDKEIQRPAEVIEARLRKADGRDIPITIISRDKYMRFSDKTTANTINSVYYDPQRKSGALYTWPACDDVQEYIVMTVRYPLEDLVASTDDFDIPPEWFEALSWILSTRIAPKYGKQLSADFILRTEGMKENLKGFDRENVSITIEMR